MRSKPFPLDPRYTVREDGAIFGVTGKELALQKGPYYLQVTTMAGTFKVHHMVAMAYLGPKPEGLEVDHFDGDSFNNAATNLRYVTHTENMAARYEQSDRCRRGHPFTPENTIWTKAEPRSRRTCRTCRRMWDRESRKRNLTWD